MYDLRDFYSSYKNVGRHKNNCGLDLTEVLLSLKILFYNCINTTCILFKKTLKSILDFINSSK